MSNTTAAYLRVSTPEQSLENQRHELAQLASARGLQLDRVYEEQASGADVRRAALEQLRDDARRGRVHVVLVWALDRLGRTMHEVLGLVLELDALGVRVLSAREPWLDNEGPVRSLLLAVFGWVAEQERARLGERTRAGLERARRRGVQLGRPRARVDLRTARRLRAEGLSLRDVAAQLGVSTSTLHRALTGD